MEHIARQSAKHYNQAKRRLKVLEPLLEDDCNWRSLWKAGFWDYWVEYRIKSLWHSGNWRSQCSEEALGEICDILSRTGENITKDVTSIKLLASKAQAEIDTLKTTVLNCNTQLPTLETRKAEFDSYTRTYQDRSLQASKHN
jgi:hypothetical protein